MNIENKTTHGVWGAVAGLCTLVASFVTYTVKESQAVLDKVETQELIQAEFRVIKIEELEEEKKQLEESVRKDMRIDKTETLATQNEGRIEDLEDAYLFQSQVILEIRDSVVEE